jgi:serine-type D-Ala-D-Ala carboxypeptidase (penicillin-binding protein 5/6)
MIIPATISLLISTIFLNLALAINFDFKAQDKVNAAGNGRVLGVTEYQAEKNIFVEPGNKLNDAIVQVIEEAKSLPLPTLPQLPSLDLPMQKLPENSDNDQANKESVDFDLPAENGAIFDLQNDQLFFSKRSDRAWPIASITKLFTAYTFLDFNPGWETSYEIKAEDKREGGKIYFFPGDIVKVKDLFYFSLVGSDNTATIALVHSTGLSEQEFVQKMNEKIKEMGLKNTRFEDAVGLSQANISTAREIALFAKTALANSEISRATLTKRYECATEQGRKKSIDSTDQLLDVFPENGVNILGGKTGFINSAGYCLVGRFKNHLDKEIITVVLGADSDTDRFDLTKKMVKLYYGAQP